MRTLEAVAISKNFGAVQALVDGRLTVSRGEIHALLGSNGCGKSTLCKIIAGALEPSSGVLNVEGQPVQFTRPKDAEKAGIALFYQELSLVPQLTVAENIFLGREPRRGPFVDRAAMTRQAQDLIALFQGVTGSGLVPEALVGELPPDLRQIVEILKVLALRPRLMIMDEATAALDARQSQRFFEILKSRKTEGVSTIFISHRLDEVFAVSDKITVMRDGSTVDELETAHTDRESVVKAMVGGTRPPAMRAAASARAVQAAATLELEGVSNSRLRDVTLKACSGEIVGLGGLQGQGQSALLRGLFGQTPFLQGRFRFENQSLTLRKPSDAVRHSFALVSGDRGRDASLQGRSIFENLVAALMVRDRAVLLRPSKLKPRVENVAADLRTKFSSLSAPIGTLSGGNQQKIFIARWLATAPKLLLLDDPTKGIDLGAKADLFALMRRLAEEGATILFYSSEDSELLENCDRILVFNGGRIAAELQGTSMTALNLTRAAYGDAA